MQVPYAQGLRLEALVSRKGENREVLSEGSETTKLGTAPSTPLRINQAEIVYSDIVTWVSKHIIVTPQRIPNG